MKKIKAIIVDDEQDARDVLGHLIALSNFPVEIVAACSHLEEGVEAIRTHSPDVVFLDVEMPNYAGYEIAEFFEEIHFEIIFTTAYQNYAIKAFELCAIDYLLKPINRSRLNTALERLCQKLETRQSADQYRLLLEQMQQKGIDKIVINEQNGKRILALDEIICIQGQGSYSVLYLKNEEKIVSSKNLRHYESILNDSQLFFRSQKSWIVNVQHIVGYQQGPGNIQMENNIVAKLSPQKIEAFKAQVDLVLLGNSDT